jgi:hypothetical protein
MRQVWGTGNSLWEPSWLCGVDFLSKLQPNSGLKLAIGDAHSSPKAGVGQWQTRLLHITGALHQSHTCLD